MIKIYCIPLSGVTQDSDITKGTSLLPFTLIRQLNRRIFLDFCILFNTASSAAPQRMSENDGIEHFLYLLTKSFFRDCVPQTLLGTM